MRQTHLHVEGRQSQEDARGEIRAVSKVLLSVQSSIQVLTTTSEVSSVCVVSNASVTTCVDRNVYPAAQRLPEIYTNFNIFLT